MADTPTKMPEIVIDHRELRSPVAKTLERLGVKLTFKTLLVGDYVVSDRILYHCTTINIKDENYRLKEYKKHGLTISRKYE